MLPVYLLTELFGCAVRGPGGPGRAGGGRGKLFRNSLSSSGCRDIAIRSLSERIFVFGRRGAFCKSGGSVRNVTFLSLFESTATTVARCQGRYFSMKLKFHSRMASTR